MVEMVYSRAAKPKAPHRKTILEAQVNWRSTALVFTLQRFLYGTVSTAPLYIQGEVMEKTHFPYGGGSTFPLYVCEAMVPSITLKTLKT